MSLHYSDSNRLPLSVSFFFAFSAHSLFIKKNVLYAFFVRISISVKFIQRLSFECISCTVHTCTHYLN